MIYTDYDSTIALSTEDHKEAALYFHKIFPIHSSDTVPKEVQEPIYISNPEVSGYIKRFCSCKPEELEQVVEWKTREHLWRNGVTSGAWAASNATAVKEYFSHAKNRWGTSVGLVETILENGISRNEKIIVPIFSSKGYQQRFCPPGDDDVVELILPQMNLINTKKLDWDQILEIKKDKDTNIKIQKMRTFIFNNYQNLPVSFIRDDIATQFDEYEQACQKHGLELLHSSLSLLVDSKSLLTVISLSTVALTLGIPLASLTPVLLAEALRETVKLMINAHEKKMDLKLYKRHHPLQFIFEIMSQQKQNGAE